MKIVLVRHAKPDFEPGPWVAPRGLAACIHRYNQATIKGSAPPALLARASGVAIILSSSLLRSSQSARQLAGERNVLAEPLFREADLPHTLWRRPKLPYQLWALLFRLAWFCGFGAGGESHSQATARARVAAARLIALARSGGSVLLVGHGIMNSLIATQLKAMGARGPARLRSSYWQFGEYAIDPQPADPADIIAA